jgi:hypothetical protein
LFPLASSSSSSFVSLTFLGVFSLCFSFFLLFFPLHFFSLFSISSPYPTSHCYQSTPIPPPFLRPFGHSIPGASKIVIISPVGHKQKITSPNII